MMTGQRQGNRVMPGPPQPDLAASPTRTSVNALVINPYLDSHSQGAQAWNSAYEIHMTTLSRLIHGAPGHFQDTN